MDNKNYSRKYETLRRAMALSYALKPKNRSFEKVLNNNMKLYDNYFEIGRITEEERDFLKQENMWAYNKITHKMDK